MKANYTNTKTFKMVFSALMVALSTVLSIFALELPFGGSITIFSMVPLIFLSQMYGVGWGFAACTVYGLVQMSMGLDNFGYVSGIVAYIVVFLFDYVLAFCVIGLSGCYPQNEKQGCSRRSWRIYRLLCAVHLPFHFRLHGLGRILSRLGVSRVDARRLGFARTAALYIFLHLQLHLHDSRDNSHGDRQHDYLRRAL